MGVSRHTYGRVRGAGALGRGVVVSVSARFVIVARQRYRISELTIMISGAVWGQVLAVGRGRGSWAGRTDDGKQECGPGRACVGLTWHAGLCQ